jgi:hypothetical protein
MSERTIEMTVCGKAELAGWMCRKCQWVGRRGAPDRLFAKAGRLIFIEFKAKGQKLDPHQEREMHRLAMAGIEAYVVDSIDHGLEILGLAP